MAHSIGRSGILALVRACHPGPTLAVTALTALLARAAGHGPASGALVTAAVFTGQLGIGWSNDVIDAERDRSVGRPDKPIAAGLLPVGAVRVAIGGSLVACLVLSLACGLVAGAVHLLLGVASGWGYNLRLKATRLSPLPYAVAFAALPAVVWLANPVRALPPVWVPAAGAVLGVGAHLLNALPDLDGDLATAVLGLPQRLGARRVRLLAPLVLLAGTVIVTTNPVVLTACLALAAVAVAGPGRVPFAAAIAIAGIDVATLALRAG